MNTDCVEGKDGRFYEICVDELGKRVWINADDGSSVARFNTSMGVDVHNTVTAQMAGAPECLWCTHEKPDYKTWQQFIKQSRKTPSFRSGMNSVEGEACPLLHTMKHCI